MNSIAHIYTVNQQPFTTKLTQLEKPLTQEHATDQHYKQFILTAFWCRGTDTKCSQFLISNELLKINTYSVIHC